MFSMVQLSKEADHSLPCIEVHPKGAVQNLFSLQKTILHEQNSPPALHFHIHVIDRCPMISSNRNQLTME